MATKVALVTGGNKGIGLHIVRGLCKELGAGSVVYLGSRSLQRGQQAVDSIAEEKLAITPTAIQLDITSDADVDAVRKHLEDKHGGLDVLVNNAGFAFKQAATEPIDVQAAETMAVNFYGTKRVCEALLPLLRPGARVVNVGSMAGKTDKYSAEKRDALRAPDLTVEQLVALCEQFKADTKAGTHREQGWPGTTYGVSKTAVHQLTRIYARDLATIVKDPTDILINTVCPGWCKSDMAGWDRPPKTPEQGARASIMAATLPAGAPTASHFTDDAPVTPIVDL
eukprot:m.479184 g.479184  ORF g.479184 m.479184 type:complete len:282 (-) comp21354_c0_seq1:230-1075(-)